MLDDSEGFGHEFGYGQTKGRRYKKLALLNALICKAEADAAEGVMMEAPPDITMKAGQLSEHQDGLFPLVWMHISFNATVLPP